ncbi:CGNR zinc finger domain-containing protein [Micrococcus luteus]|uniref:CGNR zinc finger domain-containing protein n=1 Tax=Micrococcus luteus TaxID=1270 RepID=UPI00162A98FF|nr:CGNR zinc finger domain-containing protein [Micrococcus luteus]
MLSAPTLTRLASLAAFLNTAPGLRGGQPADERFTAATQLPSLVPELQEDEVRLRLAAAAAVRGRELRGRLAEVWALAAVDEAAAVERVNALLAAAGPLRLTAGGDVVGLAPAQVPADAVERLAAMAALALAETAMDGELTRLRVCEGEDCENALVDASRNRSKRFCDEANCANRTHVRSYRARLAEAAEAAPATDPAGPAGPEEAEAPEAVADEAAPADKPRQETEKEKKERKKAEKKAEKKARKKAEKKARKKKSDKKKD